VNRRDRLVLWLAAHVPSRVLAEPERFLVAVAVLLIGADAILPPPAQVFLTAPPLFNLEFGGVFLAGGLATLAGLWNHRVWLERLGQALTVVGCATYVFAGALYAGVDEAPPVLIYAGIAGAYAVRLLSTAVARIRLHRSAQDKP